MKTQQLFSQSWSEVTSGERNAIVFERLHKSYGAFQIRRDYGNTLLKSFSALVLFLIFISVLSFIPKEKNKPEIIIPKDKTTVLQHPTETPITNPHIDPPHRPVNSNQNTAPVVDSVHVIDTTHFHQTEQPTSSSGTFGKDTSAQRPNIIPDQSAQKKFPVDTIISFPEQMPHFPGGDEKLLPYLKNHIQVPQMFIGMGGISERVGVVFVIGKDGSIISASILQGGSRYAELNDEALSVVKNMPKWEPGKQNGMPVKVQMVLPIRFEVKE